MTGFREETNRAGLPVKPTGFREETNRAGLPVKPTGFREETHRAGLPVKPTGSRRLGICRHGFGGENRTDLGTGPNWYHREPAELARFPPVPLTMVTRSSEAGEKE
jgi:hypothetical protein